MDSTKGSHSMGCQANIEDVVVFEPLFFEWLYHPVACKLSSLRLVLFELQFRQRQRPYKVTDH